jgi:hypothetical protein
MRLSLWRCLTSFLSLLLIGGVQAEKPAATEDFALEGVAIWQCQCPAYGCPCQQNGLPAFGMCHASDFAHIQKGHYGKVSLDGLNLALVGNLVDGKSERLFANLYVDHTATPEQNAALIAIIGFLNEQANQPPVPIRHVKAAPIQFHESPNRADYTVDIPAVLQEKTHLPRESSGKPRHTMPAMDLWDNTVHNADNLQFKYSDAESGESWDFSGHYANLKYFHLSRAMYAERQMLGQHGDNSGKWTKDQREIIHQQKLEEK